MHGNIFYSTCVNAMQVRRCAPWSTFNRISDGHKQATVFLAGRWNNWFRYNWPKFYTVIKKSPPQSVTWLSCKGGACPRTRTTKCVMSSKDKLTPSVFSSLLRESRSCLGQFCTSNTRTWVSCCRSLVLYGGNVPLLFIIRGLSGGVCRFLREGKHLIMDALNVSDCSMCVMVHSGWTQNQFFPCVTCVC